MTYRDDFWEEMQNDLVKIQRGILKQAIRDLSSKDIATQTEAKKFVSTSEFKNIAADIGLPQEELVKTLKLLGDYPLISRKSEIEKVITLVESSREYTI
jgi:hypothetical protein